MSKSEKNPSEGSYMHIKNTDKLDDSENDAKTQNSSTNLELVNLPLEKTKTEKHKLIKKNALNSISDIPIEKDVPLTQNDQTDSNKPNLKGNMLMCCYNKNGNPMICIGPNCNNNLFQFSRAFHFMFNNFYICNMFLLFLWSMELTQRLCKKYWISNYIYTTWLIYAYLPHQPRHPR